MRCSAFQRGTGISAKCWVRSHLSPRATIPVAHSTAAVGADDTSGYRISSGHVQDGHVPVLTHARCIALPDLPVGDDAPKQFVTGLVLRQYGHRTGERRTDFSGMKSLNEDICPSSSSSKGGVVATYLVIVSIGHSDCRGSATPRREIVGRKASSHHRPPQRPWMQK